MSYIFPARLSALSARAARAARAFSVGEGPEVWRNSAKTGVHARLPKAHGVLKRGPNRTNPGTKKKAYTMLPADGELVASEQELKYWSRFCLIHSWLTEKKPIDEIRAPDWARAMGGQRKGKGFTKTYEKLDRLIDEREARHRR